MKLIATPLFVVSLSLLVTVSMASAQLPAKLPAFCNATTPAEIKKMISRQLSCGFERKTLAYSGTPGDQAKCLLRPVRTGGGLGPALATLPSPLGTLIGKPVGIPRERLQAFLKARGIEAADIGGDLGQPTSRTAAGIPARYFVIHDTSTPNFGKGQIPGVVDSPAWPYNNVAMYKKGESSAAHIFIARTGASGTARTYETPWRATRAESCVLLEPSRGLYLHHELVQPRRSLPGGTPGNDNLAPQPPLKAITDAQMERLALAYVAASVRTGTWLVPAYHAAIDETLPGGHDDPQGFDLARWAKALAALIGDINGA